MKYFSYGMNTNSYEMALRCKTSEDLGMAVLSNYRFEFRYHATIVPNTKDRVYGVLWDITEEDEKSLDRLEGFPKYYRKELVTVIHNGEEVTAMTYIMNGHDGDLKAPNTYYYEMLREGYNDHFISSSQLYDALDRAELLDYKNSIANGSYFW